MTEPNERSCEKCKECKRDNPDMTVLHCRYALGTFHVSMAKMFASICKHYAEPEPVPEPSAVDEAWKKYQFGDRGIGGSTGQAKYYAAWHAARPHWRKEALETAKKWLEQEHWTRVGIRGMLQAAIDELAEVKL